MKVSMEVWCKVKAKVTVRCNGVVLVDDILKIVDAGRVKGRLNLKTERKCDERRR